MNKNDADINGTFRSGIFWSLKILEYPVYDMKDKLAGSSGGLILEYQHIPWYIKLKIFRFGWMTTFTSEITPLSWPNEND